MRRVDFRLAMSPRRPKSRGVIELPRSFAPPAADADQAPGQPSRSKLIVYVVSFLFIELFRRLFTVICSDSVLRTPAASAAASRFRGVRRTDRAERAGAMTSPGFQSKMGKILQTGA